MRHAMKAMVFATTLLSAAVWADTSPVGTWKTIDDKTGQAKSLVQIAEQGGEFSGKVVKLFQNPEAACDKCEGDRANKPIQGMTILWGVKKSGDSYEGGKIFDPKEGKTYSVKFKPIEGGKKLEVRGFLGVALLGRTQVWERAE